MSLGSNINNKRKSLNLSQEYVADQLGVSRQAVSKWENNLSKPSTQNLIKMATLFECDIKELVSSDKFMEKQKNLENQTESKKDIRMHMAAAFGRVFMLVGSLGFMGAISDSADLGSLPNWYIQIWYSVLFVIGLVLTFVGSRDYFNRKSGSKNIIWLDLLFVLSIFLYPFWPFGRNINTLITLLIGIVVMSIINIKFFIPTWRKPKL
ncbi:helix-turn-helix domain-containing protein [Evansella cellulosilytica]|uniref:Helix-turn-helix domain protein n=1 Tax=Evansella cellulosilytica (strain ATCC 21833 / DSM 2522 / FERM P-1141 / JCM 9156 / N-4) TaxID=649639 RepID=E6TWR2_EVAC2|nr:helix-turn-helix transcriptional regulator [Evansella cellulosilytica]ADU28745.1 helix-turn-helix domain protein [Evansella cellulosilytica DSM 2522]